MKHIKLSIVIKLFIGGFREALKPFQIFKTASICIKLQKATSFLVKRLHYIIIVLKRFEISVVIILKSIACA